MEHPDYRENHIAVNYVFYVFLKQLCVSMLLSATM
jgi:hypothetical protein